MVASGPSGLAPEIDEFRKQFKQISADADALVAPLSDEQFAWQPAPGAWSVSSASIISTRWPASTCRR